MLLQKSFHITTRPGNLWPFCFSISSSWDWRPTLPGLICVHFSVSLWSGLIRLWGLMLSILPISEDLFSQVGQQFLLPLQSSMEHLDLELQLKFSHIYVWLYFIVILIGNSLTVNVIDSLFMLLISNLNASWGKQWLSLLSVFLLICLFKNEFIEYDLFSGYM